MILRLGYGIKYTKYTYLQSSHDLIAFGILFNGLWVLTLRGNTGKKKYYIKEELRHTYVNSF